MILGGSLVSGMSLPVAILTGLAGYGFIVLMMISQGMQSVDQGKPAVVVAQQVFGKVGSSKVISIIIAIAALGWFGIQANVGGLAVANLLKYVGLPIPAWLASLLTGLLMVVTAMYGVKLIRLLAYVAVPYLVIVILYGLWFAFAKQDAAATIAAYHPSGSLSFVNGFSSTVGSFAMAGVIVGDYAQFSKKRSDVVKAAIFGVIPAGVLMIAVGAILTIAFKSTDISSLFMKIGSPVVGGLALILGTWKVNVVNAYSGGIAVANIFNIPEKYRKLTLFLVGVGGTILSILGILNYFEPVMTIFSDDSTSCRSDGSVLLGDSSWRVAQLAAGCRSELARLDRMGVGRGGWCTARAVAGDPKHSGIGDYSRVCLVLCRRKDSSRMGQGIRVELAGKH
ncbi:cytosine permease [Lacticaseibacillus rhamnosus MTCC 5462]|nr:cytosine permease [Lacticaseibacillus rhamnosus MTCC 5462]